MFNPFVTRQTRTPQPRGALSLPVVIDYVLMIATRSRAAITRGIPEQPFPTPDRTSAYRNSDFVGTPPSKENHFPAKPRNLKPFSKHHKNQQNLRNTMHIFHWF